MMEVRYRDLTSNRGRLRIRKKESAGFLAPSAANEEAFDRAIDEVAASISTLLGSLVTAASPKNLKVEAAKAHARGASAVRIVSQPAFALIERGLMSRRLLPAWKSNKRLGEDE